MRPRWLRCRDNGVPLNGREAMMQGWSDKDNPHRPEDPDAYDWYAAWHLENAECYRNFVEGDKSK